VRRNGFTLIELMIVVAMVGILSAVAMSSYNDYIETTNTAIVHDHYEQAVRTVRWEYSNIHASYSNGVARSVPEDPAPWIALMDVSNGRAPGGGPAYVSGVGVAATGAIGVSVTGSWDTGDSTVTISRPAYGSLTATSEDVSM